MERGDLDRLLRRLRGVVGDSYAFADPYEVRLYQYDASPETALPDIVVIPGTAAEVAQVVKICADANVPITARSAASSLAGGTVPVKRGVVITFARMDRILEIDAENLRAVVEPGVVNLNITRAVAADGFLYAPDPSSQQVCSIGGNVAENSGGAHCLKYGFTAHHVTGLEVVMPDGTVERFGGMAPDPPGYDVVGAFVGSEGTLGIVTRARLRLVPLPAARDASRA